MKEKKSPVTALPRNNLLVGDLPTFFYALYLDV